MKMNEDDKLQGLFHNMKLDSPSIDFENRLMKQIHIESEKAERRNTIKTILFVFLGLGAMIGFVGGIFWWFQLSLDVDMKSVTNITFRKIDFNPIVVSITFVSFLLLVSDTLIRHRFWEKKRHKD